MHKKLLLLAALLASASTHALNILSGFVYQSSVPVAIPSSGSFANNGALTGITAFPATYANAWLFFPANSICTVGTGGNPAGVYFVQMTSATAGTVFNNILGTARPTVPVSPLAFACTGPGAYTQSTAAQTLVSTPINAGLIGVGGLLSFYELWSTSTSANTKTLNTSFAGSSILNVTPTTTTATQLQQWMGNRGIQNSQVLSPVSLGGFGSSSSANTYLSVDTSVAQTVTFNGTLANASDFLVLEQATIGTYLQYN